MKLHLEKPLVFLDLETTGTNPKDDRIVEIVMLKEVPKGEDGRGTYKSLVNPQMPIPEGATKVHGITDEMVKDELPFVYIAKEVHDYIEGADIAGFNCNTFDIPMLYNEFKRAGVKWNWKGVHFVDVGNIFKIRESRTLAAAYKFYCDKNLEGAHQAEADIKATREVFLQQLIKYSEDNEFKQLNTVPKLAFYSNFNREFVDITGFFSRDEQGEIIFNVGKHKGKKAITEQGYLYWILGEPSFDDEVKAIVKGLLFGKGKKQGGGNAKLW